MRTSIKILISFLTLLTLATALVAQSMFFISQNKPASGGGGLSYSTSFPATENPLSQSGNWVNGDTAPQVDWARCRSTAGVRAFGNQGSAGGFDDSTCLLVGAYGSIQDVTATVSTTGTISDVSEVEIRLRSAFGSHINRGYEILFNVSASNSYGPQVVRWNGALGDFTLIKDATGGQIHRAVNGSVIRATIDNSGLITVYFNGASVFTVTDTTWTNGNPGMGFFTNTGDNNSNYGFSSFSATTN